MSTSLITAEAAKGFDYAALAQMIGQQTASGAPSIPMLRINKDHEDTDGRPIPAGTYAYTGLDGVIIYGTPAHLRPFLQTYQYRIYDADEEKYINQSVIFTDFRHDAPDEAGGNKCGKIPSKLKDSLSKEQADEQKLIKCTRLLFGRVSMDGVDATGAKHSLVSMPVLWRHGGSSFVPVGDAIQGLSKGNSQRLMFNYEFTMNTQREQKGATRYYIPTMSVDLKKTVEFTEDDFGVLNGFKEFVANWNTGIMAKFEKATKSRKPLKDADARTVAEVLKDDFNDELPDHLKAATIVSAG